MKRLVVCDFDGTIRRKNDRNHTRRVLEKLRALPPDVVFAVASGRPLHLLRKYFDCFKDVYIISCDGALITKNNEIIYENPISPDVFEAIEKYDEWVAYGECISYLHYKNRARGREWMKMFKHHAVSVSGISEINENIYKIFFPQKIKEIDGLLKCYAGYEISEFVNTDKGKALEFLKDKLNISTENVIAFGDSDNDIPMFKVSGKSYAFSGGTQEARNFADRVFLDLREELDRL